MNCPYCNKLINALTGLQELQKFQKHLRTCKKNPTRTMVVAESGDMAMTVEKTDLLTALDIRHESGQ